MRIANQGQLRSRQDDCLEFFLHSGSLTNCPPHASHWPATASSTIAVKPESCYVMTQSCIYPAKLKFRTYWTYRPGAPRSRASFGICLHDLYQPVIIPIKLRQFLAKYDVGLIINWDPRNKSQGENLRDSENPAVRTQSVTVSWD
jgi:hypothetical protein